MKIEIQSVTPDAETNLIEIARVSSSRKDKQEDPEKLIGYLIKNSHWSPFEHSHMTVSIETSVSISIQLLRHVSFRFQQFSQRYQDVSKVSEDGMFEPIEIRLQSVDNRQSSTEVIISQEAESRIDECLNQCAETYKWLLENGVARECARMVLPVATKTKIHMTGSLRSWIHFLEIRDDGHAQKEIQEIARGIKSHFCNNFPLTSGALGYVS